MRVGEIEQSCDACGRSIRYGYPIYAVGRRYRLVFCTPRCLRSANDVLNLLEAQDDEHFAQWGIKE